MWLWKENCDFVTRTDLQEKIQALNKKIAELPVAKPPQYVLVPTMLTFTGYSVDVVDPVTVPMQDVLDMILKHVGMEIIKTKAVPAKVVLQKVKK